MKTTIDLPEDIARRAQVIASQRKTSVEELIVSCLIHEIDAPADRQNDGEVLASAFSRGNNLAYPVGKVHRHEIYDRPILHRL